jgi:uncharacterized protein YecT (DUF1311 family)
MLRFGSTVLLLLPIALCAQHPSDRELVRSTLALFGERVHQVDCDSCEGVTPCIRICTDLEFILLDSLLDLDFNRLLQAAPDSVRPMLTNHHRNWIIARREQCEVITQGESNGYAMINYVACLNESTRLRTAEVAHLRDWFPTEP